MNNCIATHTHTHIHTHTHTHTHTHIHTHEHTHAVQYLFIDMKCKRAMSLCNRITDTI